MRYEAYLKVIDEQENMIRGISDAIWDLAELPYGEFESSKMLCDVLEKQGFSVTRGVADIPTAFTATYGTEGPSLGVLAEYDALSGFSQVGELGDKKSIPGKDSAHGCGHNLFAAGSLAAVLAVQAYIKETGHGRITLFGCPAEEGGAGKVFMVRDGVFAGTDAVVSWHPEKMYMVRTRPALANVCVNYTFEGTAAHAGGNPEKGRSALDALELMNIGCNFLREHMDLTSRVHYAILDAGGTAPNMVQSHAVVQYLIRAVDAEAVRELHQRVERIAQGAAMMTDTTVKSRLLKGYSNLITIPTLQATANEAMHDIPLPVPTEADLAYAAQLQSTMKLSEKEKAMPPFALSVLDPAPPVAHGGSTDTADVSWNCPTVQMHIGNWVVGTPGHSWQSASQSRGDYAKRSMLYAGKAVAATIMRLLDDPTLIEKAKAEFEAKTLGGYICPIPADVKPFAE